MAYGKNVLIIKRTCFYLSLVFLLISQEYFIQCHLNAQTVPVDNSINWTSLGPGGGGAMTAIAIDPVNDDIVYVGTDLAGVFKTTDGGQSFKFINKGLKNLVIQEIAIDSRNTNILYIGTEGGLYKSSDSGETWSKKVNGFIPSGGSLSYPVKAIAIDPNNSRVIYAGIGEAHGNAYVYHTTTYERYSQGQIYKSTNGGETWQLINTGPDRIETPAYIYELAVSPANPDIIFATTEKGFYKSTDGGVNWQRRQTGIPYDDVRGLAMHPSNPDVIYITVWTPQNPWQGGVFKSTDGGETWTAKNQGLKHRNDGTGHLTSNYPEVIIDPQNHNIIYTGDWAYGAYGPQKSMDGGETWTGLIIYKAGKWQNIDIRPYGSVDISALAISNLNQNLVYFGTSMCVFKTEDAGGNWIAAHTEEAGLDVWQTRGIENTCLLDIAVDPNNSDTVYFGYEDIGLLKSEDGGISFKKLRQGMDKYYPDITSIAFDPDNSSILYIAGHPGNSFSEAVVMKSIDAGNIWSIIGNGASGLPLAGAIWSQIVIDPQSPREARTLYVAKYGYGVYKSINGGMTWFAINNGLPANLNVRALAIDPENPGILYLGIYMKGQNGIDEYGGVFKTENGGSNWRRIDNYKLINLWDLAVNPRNPLIVYAAVSQHWDAANHKTFQGGVFRSTDGGETWQQVLNNKHIYSLTINPQNPNIIYAATMDYPYKDDYMSAGIYRSTDGGNNWEIVTNELPITNIYDVTIAPSDPVVIYIGTAGGGGFKGIDSSIELFAPVLASFSINSGAATTNSQTVTLNNTATCSPTHYMASESSNFSGASWQTYSASPSFTLSSGCGMKTVYLKLKNASGESNVMNDTVECIVPP